MKLCPKCRFPNTPSSSVCLGCNAALNEAAPKLLWLYSADHLVALRPGASVRLGRSKDCEVHIPDKSVSRYHAQIRVSTRGEPRLIDGGSVNGIELNGERVKDSSLRVGDTIRLGAHSLSVTRVLGFLHCPPLAPLPVRADSVLTVGRSKSCVFVLSDASVSRNQGLIRVEKDVVTWVPAGSTPTYINGKQVEGEGPLSLGDHLLLGTCEINFKSTEGESVNEQLTQSVRRETGLISDVPLSKRLNSIEFDRRSGQLVMISGDQGGAIEFSEGRPYRANFAGESGEEAIFQMLSLAEGSYAFFDKPIEIEGTEPLTTITAILLDAARRSDEASRT